MGSYSSGTPRDRRCWPGIGIRQNFGFLFQAITLQICTYEYICLHYTFCEADISPIWAVCLGVNNCVAKVGWLGQPCLTLSFLFFCCPFFHLSIYIVIFAFLVTFSSEGWVWHKTARRLSFGMLYFAFVALTCKSFLCVLSWGWPKTPCSSVLHILWMVKLSFCGCWCFYFVAIFIPCLLVNAMLTGVVVSSYAQLLSISAIAIVCVLLCCPRLHALVVF